jgi:hypothetical protein
MDELKVSSNIFPGQIIMIHKARLYWYSVFGYEFVVIFIMRKKLVSGKYVIILSKVKVQNIVCNFSNNWLLSPTKNINK